MDEVHEHNLGRLHKQTMRLFSLAEEAVQHSLYAFCQGDSDLARRVVARDPEVDEAFEGALTEAVHLLAESQQGRAGAERVAARLRICTDLERMGDLADGLSELTLSLSQGVLASPPDVMGRMADLILLMLGECIDAYLREDPYAAGRVVRLDERVDSHYLQTAEALRQRMEREPTQVKPGMLLYMAGHKLERMGDHLTNIAEEVILLTTGRSARHRRLPEAVGKTA